MEPQARRELRRAFDRRLGHPPAGARERVLAAVAREAEHPRRSDAWLAGTAAAVLIAIAIVGLLLMARGLHQAKPVTPAAPVQTATPAARTGAAVAYDARHGRLVVFGGSSLQGGGQLGDTWTWDGSRWTEAKPATAPPARLGALATYDPALGVVVYGGVEGKSPAATDTWAWDGTTWRQLSAAGGPQSAAGVALAYDPSSSSIIGYTYQPPSTGQTWQFKSGAWARLDMAGGPALAASWLGWDGQRLILVGMPFWPDQGRYQTETWAWDGSWWTQLQPAVELPSSVGGGGYDSAMRKLIVLVNGETWAWDGSTWARLHPATQPDVTGAGVAADGRGRVLAFGGDSNAAPSNELWAWEGSDWRRLSGTPNPPPTSSGRPTPVTVDPGAVAAVVAAGTTGVDPRLAPAYVPAGMTATVTAAAGGMTILYTDDTHQRTITVGVLVPNPPPGGPNASYTNIAFRGQRADYRVSDTTAPLSQRSLTWVEPGTWVNSPGKQPGVYYFASSSGITEAEFFKVLDSLQKV